MKKQIVKLLTKLKLIHGGPVKVTDYGRNLFFYTITCWKCDADMELMGDDDVEPGFHAILCGEPWKLVYPQCYDDKSTWHWDGETEWYGLDQEVEAEFWAGVDERENRT